MSEPTENATLSHPDIHSEEMGSSENNLQEKPPDIVNLENLNIPPAAEKLDIQPTAETAEIQPASENADIQQISENSEIDSTTTANSDIQPTSVITENGPEDGYQLLTRRQSPLPPVDHKKSDRPVIFLRGEQIPYLFGHLRGKDMETPTMNVISCADPICDEYIEFVARTGRPLFSWSVLRPLILWKLERIMLDMSQTGSFDHLPKIPNTDRSTSKQYLERILSASRALPGVPFTIQRICELFTQPRKHYKRADKYFRALEKCISVVTTVDSDGHRETERQPDDVENSFMDTSLTNNISTGDESLYNHAQ